ncbi:endoplasmin isoform X1 [Rhipicephalus sanguineus]|uniref:endoplasmin isoform X1 n=1 Tax=Rhipicephalus sanguineus TaxID=34632 RepID=UPI0020C4D4B4|nr:endoplasmin isoform X1 [Rhipicephalus sanguineus]
MRALLLGIVVLCLFAGELIYLHDEDSSAPKVDQDLGSSRDGSRTDDQVVEREEEAIKLDGLNVAQMKEMREKAEKHAFQAEVTRMMKLIINSLYRNKEIFLRELISNASDALDKIRLLSLTNPDVLNSNPELTIRVKSDKENGLLHIIDTGIGMTKSDLVNNLGTIAKSGTAEFLQKVAESAEAPKELNDLIGQFGVGFYSAFLVADRVIVTSKNNEDEQHVWESDSGEFTVVKDPRGNTLGRGTQVTLQLKEEARDFLELDTLKKLIEKYSQFINFNIYLWTSKTETVEEPVEETKPDVEEKDEDKVEEEEDDEPKTKKVEKTTWDWELINSAKPIWTRKPAEIEDNEYEEFYKAITKDTKAPLAKTHFIAEGELTFKALLYIPTVQPTESFNRYGGKVDHIKLYVRRVFITDDFQDMMPSYLSFIRGVVDSDDLPLNVSRETLQQHKLLKVIKKKLVRKALDMMKRIPAEQYEQFWKEYSTNLKLGIIEDTTNRTRLAKLVRFHSSHGESLTSLSEYVSRMKDGQQTIYYIAGASLDEVKRSPFVERLLKKGYEVLYLVEPVDEYSISSLTEFEGKKFQNVAKEGLKVDEGTRARERHDAIAREFEPLTKWLEDEVFKGRILKAMISERLATSPCALVANQFGWTGNMERLARSNAHAKSHDTMRDYYLSQKKNMELNPRHPLIKELLRRVKDDKNDPQARNMAELVYETATLRSGFLLEDTLSFAERVEVLMRKTLGLPEDQGVDEEPDEDAFEEGIPIDLGKKTDEKTEEEEEPRDEHEEL